MNEETINKGDISDGYHTFNELYEHRHALFIALCEQLSRNITGRYCVWRSRYHFDRSFYNGWFILGIHTLPGKQITYHLPDSYWDKTSFALLLEYAPQWDGHTSSDVIERLGKL